MRKLTPDEALEALESAVVTPVEERIDHEALLASGLAHMRDGQTAKGERLIRAAFDALLTEHSAREQVIAQVRKYRDGLPEGIVFALQDLDDSLPATEPAQPEEEPSDGR